MAKRRKISAITAEAHERTVTASDCGYASSSQQRREAPSSVLDPQPFRKGTRIASMGRANGATADTSGDASKL